MSERTKSRSRPLIWVVDDSPTEAAITRRTLGSEYDYEYIADGAIVVERLTSGLEQPDLLLLDWVMPGMAGDEVCRFLRSRDTTRELPIIIVTASRVETADLVEGLSSGANDYVARPFAAEELRARVDTAIRSRQLAVASQRERTRLEAVNKLAQSLLRARDVSAILDTLAEVLVGSLCDGCGILLLPGQLEHGVVTRHRYDPTGAVLAAISTIADPAVRSFASSEEAREVLPPAYGDYISRFGLRGLAILTLPASSPVHGVITLTRDVLSEPFATDDIVTIETCLEYCALAIQNAMRFDVERVGRAQLHAVLENIPVGIIVTDETGCLTLANGTAAELIPGIAKARDLAGVYGLARWTTPDGNPIAELDWVMSHALQAHAAAKAEIVMHRPDGERTVAVSGVPLLDAREVVVGSVTVIEDVSAARAITDARERLARFQEEMLAVVGHDLRNPLGALTAGLDLLDMMDVEHPKLTAVIGRLRSSADRMTSLVDQILDVTHARLGKGIPINVRETSLGSVVTNVVGELALAYPKTRFEVVSEGNAAGQWDPDRLSQVLANLMSNAAHYGAVGGPVVVELKGSPSSTTIHVRNPVRDKPIPKDVQAVLFDPFQRGREHGRNTGGLGLGLYIVHEIVRAHGGTIAVDSSESGTVFTVVLGPSAVIDVS
jgi:sigma-B regulation protein RsbU (phosphoserine phosphatase)